MLVEIKPYGCTLKDSKLYSTEYFVDNLACLNKMDKYGVIEIPVKFKTLKSLFEEIKNKGVTKGNHQ